MKESIKVIPYYDYTLEYIFQAGKWAEDSLIQKLKNELDYINTISGKNYSYGILKKDLPLNEVRDFFKKTNLCIIRDKDEAIGFIYDVILKEDPIPVILAGLTVVAKNRGVDFLNIPRIYFIIQEYKMYGKFYYSTISAMPAAVGYFSNMANNVWPCHKSKNLRIPPKDYLKALSIVYSQYIEKMFAHTKLDTKRFVLKTEEEFEFELDFRKLPRAETLEANVFCLYWINTAAGEDIIMVGFVNFGIVFKHKIKVLMDYFKRLVR